MRRYLSVVLMALAAALLLAGVGPALAYPVQVPTKGYRPPAPGQAKGTYVPPGSRAANDPQYASPNGPAANDAIFDIRGIARTKGVVDIAGVAADVIADVAIASTAGRVVTAACFANPIICAGAGMAAWYAYSRIAYDPATAEYVVGYDVYGYYYRSGFGGIASRTFSDRNTACHETAKAICVDAGGYCGVSSWGIREPVPEPGFPASCDLRCLKKAGLNPCTVGNLQVVPILGEQGTTEDTRPATQADMDTHADTHPIPAPAANESPVPVPVEHPDFSPTPVPVGDPYPGLDPEVGPWKQDRVVISPKTQPAPPQEAEATPGTVDVDNPNTDIDETPPVDPLPAPPETPLCELFPGSVMCVQFGTPPVQEVEKTTKDVSFVADSLGLPAACPPPIVVNGREISYQSACDGMVMIRPFVIGLAGLAALLLALAAVRGGS